MGKKKKKAKAYESVCSQEVPTWDQQRRKEEELQYGREETIWFWKGRPDHGERLRPSQRDHSMSKKRVVSIGTREGSAGRMVEEIWVAGWSGCRRKGVPRTFWEGEVEEPLQNFAKGKA